MKNNILRRELEQLRLLVKIKLDKANETTVNSFKVTGSNINGSLGIGTEDSQKAGEQIFRLPQFNQRKMLEIAVGDFHTLVVASGCNCTDPIHGTCQGRNVCNGGSELLSWGFNVHGQCNGIPTEDPIL